MTSTVEGSPPPNIGVLPSIDGKRTHGFYPSTGDTGRHGQVGSHGYLSVYLWVLIGVPTQFHVNGCTRTCSRVRVGIRLCLGLYAYGRGRVEVGESKTS